MEQEGEKVSLYIYDLSQGMARQISTTFIGNTIEGIWHSGIGLFGKEYFYGAGIQSVPIGRSPFGRPVEVLELGYTHIPKEIFAEFLQEIGPRYTMATYSFLSHNCNTFTDEAAQFLVGSGIPPHILRQADMALNNPLGALMLPMLQQLETTLQNGGTLVAPSNHLGGSPLQLNPSTLPRSTSRVSMTRQSASSFPAPFPAPFLAPFQAPLSPAASNIVPPTDPVIHVEPTAPRGSEQSEMEDDMDIDIEKTKGK